MSFNRDEYIQSVIAEAVEFDDPIFECTRCGSEVWSWALPAHVHRPPDPDPPDGLCLFCWAEWAADTWEKAERRGS